MNNQKLIKGSYKEEDCTFLLRDLSDIVDELSVEDKESLISSGVNYGKLLSKEYEPKEEDIEIFKDSLNRSSKDIARYVVKISEEIYKLKGNDLVLVSLARAGTPFGILVKRYLDSKYKINVPHYSVSIIRELGIDEKAIIYILEKHKYCRIQFIDGWTGKGSINKELRESIDYFNRKYQHKYKIKIDYNLAVIADAAGITNICGTRKDILIPNACLNSTVSGLVSRTIYSKDDFHGAKLLKSENDFSNIFIDEIEKHFKEIEDTTFEVEEYNLGQNVTTILKIYTILSPDLELELNKIKLSIGETLRALLRRNPKCILVKNKNNEDLKYVLKLAEDKGVEIIEADLGLNYECACIID